MARFSEKINAQIMLWFSLQSGLKHFKYIQLHILINVQRFSWKVWLFCEFLIQVEFFTLMFGKGSKIRSDECPIILSRFVLLGRKDLKKPIFVSINFAFPPKRYIHKLQTQHSYKKFPWDPSRTSNKKNVLILLNKLTSKGAVRYLIIRYGKLWCVCVWSGGTHI